MFNSKYKSADDEAQSRPAHQTLAQLQSSESKSRLLCNLALTATHTDHIDKGKQFEDIILDDEQLHHNKHDRKSRVHTSNNLFNKVDVGRVSKILKTNTFWLCFTKAIL